MLGVAILIQSSVPALGQSLTGIGEQKLLTAEAQIMDRLVDLYGDTNWSEVSALLAANAGSEGNPNIVMISLSLSNVYVNRFERGNDIADLLRAVQWADWAASNHELWSDRWLTAPVASYLALTAFRLREHRISAEFGKRLDRVWKASLRILEVEADLRLVRGLPYEPLESAETGDSKGEENAWEAGLLAAASAFLPEHAHAPVWEHKARQLAYDSLRRGSDPLDSEGVHCSTITEDFLLSNHGYAPNPFYMAATLVLLTHGALFYRLTGQPIPVEFGHNVAPFYDSYRTFVDERLDWTVSADPSGDAALFPFVFDPGLERGAVSRRLAETRLWIPTPPVDVMHDGEPLWTAVMNSKTVFFYLSGSYLWRRYSLLPPETERPGLSNRLER